MQGQSALFSDAKTGGTDSWGTPQPLYDLLHAEFEFTLDPCADATNAKAAYFSIEEGVDGLEQDWGDGDVFVNFPYSDAKRWAAKCIDAADKGALVVVLCASRTDTGWWQSLANVADEVRFIKGRLAFTSPSGIGQSAPFPSSLIVLRPGLWQNESFPIMKLWELPPAVRRGAQEAA